MRILFLTQVLPYPLDSGPKIRAYYVLRQLAAQHQITLVSFVRTPRDLQDAEHLRHYCEEAHLVPILRSKTRDAWHMARSILSGRPFVIERDRSASMWKKLRELTSDESYDAIHADQLNMAQYALRCPAQARVLDAHNAVWTVVRRLCQGTPWGLRRMLLELEWRKMRRYEGKVCAGFDQIIAVTEEDRHSLATITDDVPNMHVVPIAVDAAGLPQVERDGERQRIISVGTMFWPPNVEGMRWFVESVYPLVRREIPEAGLDIVGARPVPEVRKLAQPSNNIRVLGYVEDIAPHLSQSAVFIVPLRAGGGMRVKILDAWVRGIPIVSTSIGCEGIKGAIHGENILVADRPGEFAEHVVRVIRDRNLAARLADRGRHTVETWYDWRSVYKDYARLYHELALEAKEK